MEVGPDAVAYHAGGSFDVMTLAFLRQRFCKLLG